MRGSRWIVLLSLPLLGACASGTSGAAAPSTSSSSPSATQAGTAGMRTMAASITASGATSSRLSGTITLTPLDANTYSVTMDLRGGPASRQVPWAIRPGACGDVTPNSDIGSRSVYGPIQTQADGQAHVNTRLRVQLPSQQTLHIDIMQSNSQRDVVLACGILLGR
jgi:hypothetical protein